MRQAGSIQKTFAFCSWCNFSATLISFSKLLQFFYDNVLSVILPSVVGINSSVITFLWQAHGIVFINDSL
jgi:hypothetical protein